MSILDEDARKLAFMRDYAELVKKHRVAFAEYTDMEGFHLVVVDKQTAIGFDPDIGDCALYFSERAAKERIGSRAIIFSIVDDKKD